MQHPDLQLDGYSAVGWRGKVVTFGGMTRPNKALVNKVFVVDAGEGVVEKVEAWGEVPTEQACHSVVVKDGDMFVIQGLVKVVTCEQRHCVPVLNLETMEWRLLSTTGDAPAPRCYHASAVVGQKIYTYGGYPLTDSQVTAQFNVLSLDTLMWSTISVQNFSPVWGHSLVSWVSNEVPYLVLFGGVDGKERVSNKVNIFNTASGEGRVMVYEDVSDRVEVGEATHSFVPEKKHQIKIDKGDLISILPGEMSGWRRGFVHPDHRGWFPANYIKILPAAKLVPQDTLPPSKTLCMNDLHKRFQVKETGEVVIVETRRGDPTFGYKKIPQIEYSKAETAYVPSRNLTIPAPRTMHAGCQCPQGLFIWSGEHATIQLTDAWTLDLTGGATWTKLEMPFTPDSSVPAVYLPEYEVAVLPLLSKGTCVTYNFTGGRVECEEKILSYVQSEEDDDDIVPCVRREDSVPRGGCSTPMTAIHKITPLAPSEWLSPMRQRFPGSQYHSGAGGTTHRPLASPRDHPHRTNLDLPRSPYSERTPDIFFAEDGRVVVDSPRDWVPGSSTQPPSNTGRRQSDSPSPVRRPSLVESTVLVANCREVSPPVIIPDRPSPLATPTQEPLVGSATSMVNRRKSSSPVVVPERPSPLATPTQEPLVGSAASMVNRRKSSPDLVESTAVMATRRESSPVVVEALTEAAASMVNRKEEQSVMTPRQKGLMESSVGMVNRRGSMPVVAIDSPREWVPRVERSTSISSSVLDKEGDELLVKKKEGEVLGMTWKGNVLIEVVKGGPAGVCGGEKFIGRRVTHVVGVPVEGISSIKSATEDMKNVRFRFDPRQLSDAELIEHLLKSLNPGESEVSPSRTPRRVMRVSPPHRTPSRSRSRSRSNLGSHHLTPTMSSLRKRASWDSARGAYISPVKTRPAYTSPGMVPAPSPRRRKKSPSSKRRASPRRRSGSVVNSSAVEKC